MGRDRPDYGEIIPYLSIVWGPSSTKSALVCFCSSDFCSLLGLQVEGLARKADPYNSLPSFAVTLVCASLHVSGETYKLEKIWLQFSLLKMVKTRQPDE